MGPVSTPTIALLRKAMRSLNAAQRDVQLACELHPDWMLELEQTREYTRKANTWCDTTIDLLVRQERDRRLVDDLVGLDEETLEMGLVLWA